MLGRYTPVLKLAQGGMGEILLARIEGAAGFTKPVVLKRIRSGLAVASVEEMFVQEARLLSYVRHPGVVQVVDFGQEGADFIMVLEYVHGYDLRIWFRYLEKKGRAFEARLAIHILSEVLEALDNVNHLRTADGREMTLVHRDISLANVLIDTEGHVKLTDFGIAKAVKESTGVDTEPGSLLKGKLPFMAPELLSGNPPTIQSDVYACGVVLHQLLFGRNEFHVASSPVDTIDRIRHHIPSPIANVREDVPRGIDQILARALAKNPAERYENAGEFAQDLGDLLGTARSHFGRVLGQAAREDFLADLPEVMKIPSLEDRSRALTDGADDTDDFGAMPLGPGEITGTTRHYDGRDEPPTDPSTTAEQILSVGTSSEDATSGSEGGRTWLKRILVAGGLAGALGAAVALATTAEEGSATSTAVVAVEEPTEPGPAETNPAQTSPAETTPAEATEQDADGSERTTEAEEGAEASPQVRITQAFARNRDGLLDCFADAPELASELDAVILRFSLASDGTVRRVRLRPQSIVGTELGACLTRVGETTDFPGLGSPITFEIPLRTRVIGSQL